MKELQTQRITLGIHKGDTKFSMQEIKVDGINCRRPITIYDRLFFSLKEEENDDGQAMDTGFVYHYDPEKVVSDEHWMTCEEVVGVGRICPRCEEIVK